MQDIYRRAGMVLSWLGPDNDNAQLAIELIDTVSDEMFEGDWEAQALLPIMRHSQLWENDVETGTGNSRWNALNVLLHLGYWTRVWIVQELVLSQECCFMVGKYYFELGDLMDVYEFLRFLNTGAMSGNSIPREVLNNTVLGCVKIPGWVPTSALSLINQLRDSDNQFDGHYPLLYTIYTEKYHATNPRDKIYAILGIGQSSLLPDYSKSVETVYTEFAESCLQHDYWWLLFCVGGLGNPIPSSLSVPSWVPDWHALSVQIDAPEGLGTWTGFESGKGLNVSGETRPYVDDMTRLHTPGMVVDAVADVAPPVDGTNEELRDFCNELTSRFPRTNHEIWDLRICRLYLTHLQ